LDCKLRASGNDCSLNLGLRVSGKSDIPFPKQVLLDIEYIQKRSLWMDIKLLLRTLPAVLLTRGAY
jgi:lipopolysaccharide/colanic/teichoic acid biosynthesis glycosyltransferase